MIKIDHGGFAFPTQAICTPAGDVMSSGDDGMTLRDWFAGQALAGLLASDDGSTRENVAAEAYDIADAMIAARKAGEL